jgi:hypothetical protein
MLTDASPHLPFPDSSQVRGELRELRCHYGRELYRARYRRSRNLFILLHIFRKDTGAIPEPEIQVADQRWVDFKPRMGLKRKPPRATGTTTSAWKQVGALGALRLIRARRGRPEVGGTRRRGPSPLQRAALERVNPARYTGIFVTVTPGVSHLARVSDSESDIGP